MTTKKTLDEIVTDLRIAVDVTVSDIGMQQIYERWLKHETWQARSEALPLLVGVDPDVWNAYLEEHDLIAAEGELWADFGLLGGGSETVLIAPAKLRTHARDQGIAVPMAFERLSDFIMQVSLAARPEAGDDDNRIDGALALSQEREIILGAALSLVSKIPDQCRDENGFFDGAIIADEILKKAVVWYGTSEPSYSKAQVAALIEKWLA